MTEKVKPTLLIELNVRCPECNHYFDMVNETNLNEEGWLLNQLLPEGTWTNEHENFECAVTCTECSVEFEVAGVDW